MKPTRQEVAAAVIAAVAKVSGLQPEKIKEEYILKEHPLKLDDQQLNRLTLKLRKYIKSVDSAKTIWASTVQKSGQSVEGLIDYIFKLLNS